MPQPTRSKISSPQPSAASSNPRAAAARFQLAAATHRSEKAKERSEEVTKQRFRDCRQPLLLVGRYFVASLRLYFKSEVSDANFDLYPGAKRRCLRPQPGLRD